MNYTITATANSGDHGELMIKESTIAFGTREKSAKELPNPAELFLGAFAACILKNVARFSDLLKFNYDKAVIKVTATRLERPPSIDKIHYELIVYSKDEGLNIPLLKKNIEKFGTIYNTVNSVCTITGIITKEGSIE